MRPGFRPVLQSLYCNAKTIAARGQRIAATAAGTFPGCNPRGWTWPARVVLIGFPVFMCPGLGAAQSNNSINVGSIVEPVGTLPLRDGPPGGLFGGKGEVVGQASADHRYRILNEKTISTVLGQQTWLMLQDTTSRQSGWIYSGSDSRPFQNVTQR